MQRASEWQHRAQPSRLLMFPAMTAVKKHRAIDVRTQFERLLIFVLCSLWAVGMVAWTLVSVAGIGHGVASARLAQHAFTAPTSIPTLQTATLFAIRLMIGW